MDNLDINTPLGWYKGNKWERDLKFNPEDI